MKPQGFPHGFQKKKTNYEENVDKDDDISRSDVVKIYFFYTTWCPYSTTAIPEWERIMNKYKDESINGYKMVFIGVDCTKETLEVEEYIKRFKIEGYPTIKLVKDDQIIEFDAKANYENIEKFLKSFL